MARSWLSIRVELIEGHGEMVWPRPGRLLACARSHSFAQLATAIDVSFARWDLAHLHDFTFADGSRATTPYEEWNSPYGPPSVDDRKTTLNRLQPGEQFAYTFDFGDDWHHLCTVGDKRIDPFDIFGVMPIHPEPYWGWGSIPDQYGRRWEGDDGESETPDDPRGSDLPPLKPLWGQRRPTWE